MRSSIIKRFNSLSIRKKIIYFYLIFVVIPLFVADGLIAGIVYNSESKQRYTLFESTASSIEFELTRDFDMVDEMTESVYLNRGIYTFLDKEYQSGLEYYNAFQDLKKTSTLWELANMENCSFNFYADNSTLIGGGGVQPLDKIKDTVWYKDFVESGKSKLLWFGYFKDEVDSYNSQKHIYLIRKLDYYPGTGISKILVFELDYDYLSNKLSALIGTQDEIPYEVVAGKRVIISNDVKDNATSVFKDRSDESLIVYSKDINLYGCDMSICILRNRIFVTNSFKKNYQVILVLVAVSLILPLIGILAFRKFFTDRLINLSNVVQNSGDEHLELVEDTEGADEIAILSRRYNNMALRINNLIETVYKHQIQESKSTVARQKAELLALQSQINPHFLFNALESIRMHSIIKHEEETARMIENLAVIQRQYVEWSSDIVKICDEMNFVKAYLELQSYRFGDRLSYQINVESDAEEIYIPKLSIVTFVENACIHGIEPKSNKGWVFVRVYKNEKDLFVEIEDTGIGMEDEEVEKLLDSMNNANIEMLQQKSRVGIINACIRLKMYTDSKVVFEVSSEKGIGTIVTVRMEIIC